MLNIGLFYWSGKPWDYNRLGLLGAEGLKFFGFEPETWLFFRDNRLLSQSPGGYDPLFYGTLLNIGVFLGAFMGSVVHKEFRIRWPAGKTISGRSFRRTAHGIWCAPGRRLQRRCFSRGTASFSLHGWLFGLVLIPGAWLGFKLSQKLFYS